MSGRFCYRPFWSANPSWPRSVWRQWPGPWLRPRRESRLARRYSSWRDRRSPTPGKRPAHKCPDGRRASSQSCRRDGKRHRRGAASRAACRLLSGRSLLRRWRVRAPCPKCRSRCATPPRYRPAGGSPPASAVRCRGWRKHRRRGLGRPAGPGGLCCGVCSCSCPASVSRGHLEAAGHGGDMVDFHDLGNVNAWRHHRFRIELPRFNDAVNRGHGEGGRRRHDRAKVAGGFSESQVAPPVTHLGLDQGHVAINGVLQHIGFAVDEARFLRCAIGVFGQLRAESRGGEEGADTRTGCTQPLGQIALRNQLQLDLAAPVEIVKDPGVGLPGKAADDLAHTARLEQCGDAHIAIARVVVHDSQLACTLLDETVNQLGGDAGGAKAANQHRGAVLDVRQGRPHVCRNLVDHDAVAPVLTGFRTKSYFNVWKGRSIIVPSGAVPLSWGTQSEMSVERTPKTASESRYWSPSRKTWVIRRSCPGALNM